MRVFRLDQGAVVQRLRTRAGELLAARPDVVAVRLFGSLARGEGHPGSDADLFVVLRDGAPPFLERIPDLARHFGGVGVGCDVIAYTETEAATLRRDGDAFAHVVFDEGISLAQRAS